MAIGSEKEELMLKQSDEILHDFLAHCTKPEFEKDRTLVPVVRAELVKRMDDRLKATVEQLRKTHELTGKLDQKTLWILWLTGVAALLALLGLLVALLK